MKRAIRTAAKSGFLAADLFAGRMPGPRLLIYHQVGAEMGRQMEVTEAHFRRHVEWLVANGDVVSLDRALAEREKPGDDRRFVLTFDDGYADMYDNAWPLLRDQQLPFTLYLTTEPVETGVALTPGGRAEPLTWAQIDEMLNSDLMTLGAHTHRHRELGDLELADIEEEISVSNDLIEQRTGVTPTHFAYPWGYWSPVADSVLRRVYETATLGSGAPISADTDLFKLNRVPVQLSDGFVFFRRKMNTGLMIEDKLRRRLAKYDGP